MDLAPFRDFLAFGATMLGLVLAALMAVSAIVNGDHRRVEAAALALPLAALSTSPAVAAWPGLIVLGERIGPAALGMSRSQLSRAISAVPGKATRLPTGHVAVTAWHVYQAGITFRAVRLSDDPKWGATIACVSVFMPAVRPVLADRCRS
jgi:hypothetical protein